MAQAAESAGAAVTAGMRRRGVAMLAAALLLFGWLMAVCGGMQSRAAADTKETAVQTRLRTEMLTASRGEIMDRNGVPLVQNRTVYQLCFDGFSWDAGQAAEVIRRVLALLTAHSISYEDAMPVTAAAPWRYTAAADSTDARRMARVLRHYGLAEDLSAEDAVASLREVCRVPDEWDDRDVRRVLGVLYDMVLADFSEETPFTIAEDVGMEIVSIVSEQAAQYPDVMVRTDSVRELRTAYAAHILGRTGTILSEDAAAFAAAGYAPDAIIGRDGAERAFEVWLRGEDGMRTVEVDAHGCVLGVTEEIPARSGGDVYLTIDLRLQQAAEDALAKHIESLRESGVAAEGGAAVVLDVRNGDVLALASYPGYTLATFGADYRALSSDPLAPLFNRAIMGTYAPGSTFKPVTAIAAMKEGAITRDTQFICEGIYQHFAPRWLYHCWVYRDLGKTHGELTAAEALQESCNCFFYEAGRLTGIGAIREWAEALGLGSRTGIELAGESAGVLAGQRNSGWYAGDTLQAAIGQSDHLFTPLQLASYMAALANGGTLYGARLLQRVVAPAGRVIYEQQPVVRNVVAFSDEIYDTIKEGMLAVTSDGTASTVFSDYHIPVMGKSGSAQVSAGQANGLFILAAPADAPEIAVAVVIEHGASGNNAARVARDILTAYFGEAIPAAAPVSEE